jgi:peptidoglycan/xylan/chitin deacetylase (PgdA/CDA1 family)
MELLPVEKDSIDGQALMAYFAVIAAWAGEKDLALQQLATAAHIWGSHSHELRHAQAVSLLGPTPRRSALRENCGLLRAERGRVAREVRFGDGRTSSITLLA